jgi:ABC-type sugar transport system permease subunit
MKMSFLLSIALGIMMVVAAIVFWKVLDGMHVFTEVDAMVKEILGEKTTVNILQYVELSRVVSLATILAIVDVVLLTAIGTIGAFLYNVVAALVGGIHLTLTDD